MISPCKLHSNLATCTLHNVVAAINPFPSSPLRNLLNPSFVSCCDCLPPRPSNSPEPTCWTSENTGNLLWTIEHGRHRITFLNLFPFNCILYPPQLGQHQGVALGRRLAKFYKPKTFYANITADMVQLRSSNTPRTRRTGQLFLNAFTSSRTGNISVIPGNKDFVS